MIKNKVELSSEFKSQAIKSIYSIVIFSIVYLLLFMFALILTASCIYGGFMLAISIGHFIGVILGLGVISIGVLVLFFLLKFIFTGVKMDRSHLLEINQEGQPELFKLINDLTIEIGTPFPKKIYLSSDVNASVFYDSSFWSMFLPVKKNLTIGLGLVNSIHEEEFKAILAHEFGHFSQKTMKVGSYIYNLNRIIFNMLYDNEAYEKLMIGLANTSGYIAPFVMIAGKIVETIQEVLKIMYEIINKPYLGLSREMEFHADEIAANVTGYGPLKDSLLRMDLVDYAYNSVLSFYEKKFSQNIKSENIFKEQSFVMEFIALEDNIPMNRNLPVVTLTDLNKFNKSKLVIKDQWASHPSTEDRVKRLESTNLVKNENENHLANNLFRNIDNLQRRLTEQMFSQVQFSAPPSPNSFEDFKRNFEQDVLDNSFSKLFNGYYDNKNPISFSFDEIDTAPAKNSFQELFNNKILDYNYEAISMYNDIETIKLIADKTLKLKTFDYNGKKYAQKESRVLSIQLKEQLDEMTQHLKANDIEIFKFFQNLEQSAGQEPIIKKLYENFFIFDKEYDLKTELYTDFQKRLEFINYTTPFDQITTNFKNLRYLETKLKDQLQELFHDKRYASEITDDIKKNYEAYLAKDLEYFGLDSYFDENLEILFTALNNYIFLLSRGYFTYKKELLDYKISLLEMR